MVNLVLILVNLVNILVNLRFKTHQKTRIHHFYKPHPAGSIKKMVNSVFLGNLVKILGKMVKMPRLM